MVVMIGIDPHKASHTAVALDENEQPLGELRVRSATNQVERLLQWAAPFSERTWAIEGAGGLGYLLAQQLVAAGERVVDVHPKLGARVRLLATGDTNNNDPNDARSVAVAALRSPTLNEVRAEDHAAVMKVWAKRHRDLSRHRCRVACRLHAVLCELVPGGFATEISAAQASRLLDDIDPEGAVAAARHELALELVADLRRSAQSHHQRRTTRRDIRARVRPDRRRGREGHARKCLAAGGCRAVDRSRQLDGVAVEPRVAGRPQIRETSCACSVRIAGSARRSGRTPSLSGWSRTRSSRRYRTRRHGIIPVLVGHPVGRTF
jgi:hypothetical protein